MSHAFSPFLGLGFPLTLRNMSRPYLSPNDINLFALPAGRRPPNLNATPAYEFVNFSYFYRFPESRTLSPLSFICSRWHLSCVSLILRSNILCFLPLHRAPSLPFLRTLKVFLLRSILRAGILRLPGQQQVELFSECFISGTTSNSRVSTLSISLLETSPPGWKRQ